MIPLILDNTTKPQKPNPIQQFHFLIQLLLGLENQLYFSFYVDYTKLNTNKKLVLFHLENNRAQTLF